MKDLWNNIYCLYRLLDTVQILFSPDNPFRKNLEKVINDILDDLEDEDEPNNNDADLFDKR